MKPKITKWFYQSKSGLIHVWWANCGPRVNQLLYDEVAALDAPKFCRSCVSDRAFNNIKSGLQEVMSGG